MNKLVHVAVGVIFGVDGKILIAKRPQTAHQGGLWEFPGGKVDAGESVRSALKRELMEELSISVSSSEPLIQIRHHYPDKSVLLDVYKVSAFDGEPQGAEGQPIKWVESTELKNYEFPAANKPIITALSLPERYLITGQLLNEDDFVGRLEAAFARGIRIAQLRIQDADLSKRSVFLARIFSVAKKYSSTILLNTDLANFENIRFMFPEARLGLHLNRHQAAFIARRPIPSSYLLGTSCHNEIEIEQAQKLGADYLLLSPVKATSSHPDAIPLGWDKFKSLVELASVPVFALGGVGDEDVKTAIEVGGQGVAGISAWW